MGKKSKKLFSEKDMFPSKMKQSLILIKCFKLLNGRLIREAVK